MGIDGLANNRAQIVFFPRLSNILKNLAFIDSLHKIFYIGVAGKHNPNGVWITIRS